MNRFETASVELDGVRFPYLARAPEHFQGAALLAPEKVAKLITLAVPYGPGFGRALVPNPLQQRRSWYMYFFQMPFAEAAFARDDFAFLDRLVAEWSPGLAPDPEYRETVKAMFRQPGVAQAALNYYRQAFRLELQSPALQRDQERLGQEPIQVPALYLHGAEDGCIGAEVARGGGSRFAVSRRITQPQSFRL